MLNKKPNILFTGKQVEKQLWQKYSTFFEMDVIPFIDTQITKDAKIIHSIIELSKRPALVILTSSTSIRFLHTHIHHPPDWEIACMKGRSKQLLEDIGWGEKIIYCGNSGADLAKTMLRFGRHSEVYFVGNKTRNNVLSITLSQHKILIHEIFVYKTIPKSNISEKRYDAIIFLSPSAVDSFFMTNQVSEVVTLFSIGDTTKKALLHHTSNHIVVAEDTSQLALLQSIKSYYNIP